MQVKYFLTWSFGLLTTSKIFHKEPFWAGSMKPNSMIKNSSEMMNRGGSGWRGSEMETCHETELIRWRSFSRSGFFPIGHLPPKHSWSGENWPRLETDDWPTRASLESWLVWLERSRESKRTGSGFDSVSVLPFRYKSDCLPMYLWLEDALLLVEFF